jgi:hypothetical protein
VRPLYVRNDTAVLECLPKSVDVVFKRALAARKSAWAWRGSLSMRAAAPWLRMRHIRDFLGVSWVINRGVENGFLNEVYALGWRL